MIIVAIPIRSDVASETLLVLIIYPKSGIEFWVVCARYYSVLSLLNSIDFLLIDRKDESIVIDFSIRNAIPMLLGIAAKDFALLSF